MPLYYLFWMFTGFTIHFYIIFGTNLLTGGPAQNCCFLPISVFRGNRISKESKRNETFRRVIFGTEAIQETWSRHQGSFEVATGGQGTPYPLGAPPPSWAPRGPLVAPLTDFFRLYISIYPKTTREQNRSGVPPPQVSVATKN